MTPELRFPEFKGAWIKKDVGSVLKRAVRLVEVNPSETYREIGGCPIFCV